MICRAKEVQDNSSSCSILKAHNQFERDGNQQKHLKVVIHDLRAAQKSLNDRATKTGRDEKFMWETHYRSWTNSIDHHICAPILSHGHELFHWDPEKSPYSWISLAGAGQNLLMIYGQHRVPVLNIEISSTPGWQCVPTPWYIFECRH